jgi:hypothetical protein
MPPPIAVAVALALGAASGEVAENFGLPGGGRGCYSPHKWPLSILPRHSAVAPGTALPAPKRTRGTGALLMWINGNAKRIVLNLNQSWTRTGLGSSLTSVSDGTVEEHQMIKFELLKDAVLLIVEPREALTAEDFQVISQTVDPYISEHPCRVNAGSLNVLVGHLASG